jgi:hypothetical protein
MALETAPNLASDSTFEFDSDLLIDRNEVALFSSL